MTYSEPCQTSKTESFARIVMRKNCIPVKNLQFFYDFFGRREMHRLINSLKITLCYNYRLEHAFSSKSGEILILAPICLNLVFRYKIFTYQFQIRIKGLTRF